MGPQKPSPTRPSMVAHCGGGGGEGAVWQKGGALQQRVALCSCRHCKRAAAGPRRRNGIALLPPALPRTCMAIISSDTMAVNATPTNAAVQTEVPRMDRPQEVEWVSSSANSPVR